VRLGRRAASPPLGQTGRRVLLLLLIALCVLNVCDFALTRYAMWLGFATESNWVMDVLFRQGDVVAAVFKGGVVTAGAVALWLLRRHRATLLAGVLLAGLFAAVVTYQVLWIATL
jgi:hypothetical protein